MLPINAIFSGGPINGEIRMIIDRPEYVILVVPELDWSSLLPEDGFAFVQPKKALYHRTDSYDLNCNKIFEFVGIY